jgi:hypothetical protein
VSGDDFVGRALPASLAPLCRPLSEDAGVLQAEVLTLRFVLGVIAQGIPYRGEADPRKIAASAIRPGAEL